MDHDQALELKWIRKIQKKQQAQEADLLVRAYYDEIYIYVFRQTSNQDAAMDLTQDIFISMLRSLVWFDPRKAGFRTWLYRIATNKVIDRRRRKMPFISQIDELELPDEQDFVRQVEQQDLLCKIELYVSGLEASLQQVFRLKIYGDYSFPEIAAMLDQPEAALKTQYYRLMKRLRKEFSDEYSNAN